MRFVVTGGSGFIGAHLVRHLLRSHPEAEVVNLDALTYAGDPHSLEDVKAEPALKERYRFVLGDIRDAELLAKVVRAGDIIINAAAESHVDRSITAPQVFLETNVVGTGVLAKVCADKGVHRFVQVSTDEVYGSVEVGSFTEGDPLDPSSPYSSSKASAELVALAYQRTFGLPAAVVRCTNNFGPYQFPEKVIPYWVSCVLEGHPLRIYGDGGNVRDWLYVEDCCAAISLVAAAGGVGEVYNVGAGNEMTNLHLAHEVLGVLGATAQSIEYVEDRPGHDRRYSVDSSKVGRLGWRPEHGFKDALASTVSWYSENRAWWEPLRAAMGKAGPGWMRPER